MERLERNFPVRNIIACDDHSSDPWPARKLGHFVS